MNGKDEAGFTALHYAALNGHYDACLVLVKNGANANARDSKGEYGMVWYGMVWYGLNVSIFI